MEPPKSICAKCEHVGKMAIGKPARRLHVCMRTPTYTDSVTGKPRKPYRVCFEINSGNCAHFEAKPASWWRRIFAKG